MAASILVSFVLVGYTVRENRVHQHELADAVAARDKSVNKFLRTEVCGRLQLRDEIQISYLRALAAKYRQTDPSLSEALDGAADALEFTKQGCASELPE